ncbi:MFS transporter [Anaerobacillus sp. CMMVII]|uniref:MFS transporter n=1 Tax=Anaerobacillus sp. CMMVII TaxID=2755588 RepID=UPI0021B7BE31|nr:MFS transporter [Anaerobacillus sp. CMMVII]MCT8137587.1 MFS transporter [Anaerobacillus sp. CMMVII]
MLRLFKSFSPTVKAYLFMNTFFSFGNALSGIFLSVFLWRLDETFTLLAMYSLSFSLSIMLNFSICAGLARKTSPMTTLRVGILFYIFTYLIIILFQTSLANYVMLVGFMLGMAVSLFSVGAHMSVLDLTTDKRRDKFLYVEGMMLTAGGLIGPLFSGLLIEQFEGLAGYFIVFSVTCLFFVLAILISFKIKGKPIAQRSYFWEVIKNPSKEWKRMYLVMFGEGIVSGVYGTFLISMMIFIVAGGELKLGIFNFGAEVVAIFTFLLLAKISKPERRVLIYSIGAIALFIASVFLSVFPIIIGLLIFGLIKPIASTMIGTSMNAFIYAAIEKDKGYENKRLDYIVVREIPLGLGRIIGIFIF